MTLEHTYYSTCHYSQLHWSNDGVNGVTQKELSFLLLLWGLSDPRIAELREMPRCFSIKLPSLSGERRKTLSITHHALSPPPSHHHLYIIHLINWLQRFYRITMSLKRPFMPKSDVKYYYYWSNETFFNTGSGRVEVMSRPKTYSMILFWALAFRMCPEGWWVVLTTCPDLSERCSLEKSELDFYSWHESTQKIKMKYVLQSAVSADPLIMIITILIKTLAIKFTLLPE